VQAEAFCASWIAPMIQCPFVPSRLCRHHWTTLHRTHYRPITHHHLVATIVVVVVHERGTLVSWPSSMT
jgi:hypothetical protein